MYITNKPGIINLIDALDRIDTRRIVNAITVSVADSKVNDEI